MNEVLLRSARYFRFRLRTLLALPILFAAAWWWVTWPERTARKFVRLLAEGDIAAARAMIDGEQPSAGFERIVTSGKFKFGEPKFGKASWSAYLAAERRFRFDWRLPSDSESLRSFSVRRNRVRLVPPVNAAMYAVTFALHGLDVEPIARELTDTFPDGDEHLIRADAAQDRIIVAATDRSFSEIRALLRLAEEEAEAEIERNWDWLKAER